MKNIKLSLSFHVKGDKKTANAIPVPGWDKNPTYDWSMSKTFYFENKQDAQKEANNLIKKYRNVTNIGDNEIKEFQLAGYENDGLQSYYFTYFKPFKPKKKISFHDN